MRRHLATLAPLLLAVACAVPQPGPGTPATVAAVDLNRYAGTWYEAARLPAPFQDGPGVACADVTATYAPRPAAGRVGVVNRCRNAAAGGAERVAYGNAYVVEGSNGARLRVSFFWPFHGDYWVIGLDPGYRWAVVGDPERKYLWILSRTPAMRAEDHAQAVAIARAQGFPVERLRPTPQSEA